MTAKHTLGPWGVSTGAMPNEFIISAQGTPRIARVVPEFVSINEQVANAHLIAAAPDMLELLEEWAETLKQGVTIGIQPGSMAAFHLFEALEKARGDK